jgi:peptide deformylase
MDGDSMILELVKPDHPLLHKKLDNFDFANLPCDPVELANNLIETMVHYKGLGLSANQCGLPHRVFVLFAENPFVCFNPRIVDQTTELVTLDEGCLTYPNLFFPVKRSKVIKVRYQDYTGETKNETFIGMTARGYQHELDHLNGIHYTKHANPIHLERARRLKKQIDRDMKRLAKV